MKLQFRRVAAISLLMLIVGPLLFPLVALPMVPLANASIEVKTETNYRTETNYETEKDYETKTHEQIKFKNNKGEEGNQDGTVPGGVAPSNWDVFKYTTKTILRDLTIKYPVQQVRNYGDIKILQHDWRVRYNDHLDYQNRIRDAYNYRGELPPPRAERVPLPLGKEYPSTIEFTKRMTRDTAHTSFRATLSGLGILLKDEQYLTPVVDSGLAAYNIKDYRDLRKDAAKYQTTYDRLRKSRQYSGNQKALHKTTKDALMATKSPGGKFLTRATPVFAAVGTGLAVVDTYNSFSQGRYVDGVAGIGDTLMSAAPMIALANPVAGAVVAGVGLAIWGGAKLVKHGPAIYKAAKSYIKNPKKAWQDTKKAVKRGYNKVKNGLKSGWKTVKGWFS